MTISVEEHRRQLANFVSLEHRAAYFKANVNPDAVNLSTAENILLFEHYRDTAFADLPPVGLDTIRYPLPNVYGRANYIESVQEFINNQWDVSVSSGDLYAASGVVAGLQLLAFALFKPDDEVLLPAPLWDGFHWSLSQTAGMRFIPFPIDRGVNLTAANVAAAIGQHPRAKLLVLTNPNNPLGANYSKELLEEIYPLFLKDRPDRHIISDEIYAGSQVDGTDKFVSALSLDAYQDFSSRIHVTWGLSKDFGLAGLRAGFIISKSDVVRASLVDSSCHASSCWFSPMVTTNYYLIQKLFLNEAGDPDPAPAIAAMDQYRAQLKAQYEATASALDGGNIGYLPGNHGGLFFWIDLRKYLARVPKNYPDDGPLCPDMYTSDSLSERRLDNYIQHEAGLLLVRGQACFNEEPGYFRLCYTADELPRVTEGINTMVATLNAL